SAGAGMLLASILPADRLDREPATAPPTSQDEGKTRHSPPSASACIPRPISPSLRRMEFRRGNVIPHASGHCREHCGYAGHRPLQGGPMAAVTALLRRHPEIALFVALSLGFFLGKRKLGTFSLGTSAGVLLAGILIGQLHIPIP